MIHVVQDEVRIVQPGVTERFNKEVAIPYAGDYPRLIIHPLDTLKFRLILGEGKPDMHFAALSRQSRDLIALTIRVFHARKHIATTYILNQVFANPINHGVTKVDMLNNPGMTSMSGYPANGGSAGGSA